MTANAAKTATGQVANPTDHFSRPTSETQKKIQSRSADGAPETCCAFGARMKEPLSQHLATPEFAQFINYSRTLIRVNVNVAASTELRGQLNLRFPALPPDLTTRRALSVQFLIVPLLRFHPPPPPIPHMRGSRRRPGICQAWAERVSSSLN